MLPYLHLNVEVVPELLGFAWPFLLLSRMNVHAHAHVCASAQTSARHIVCEYWSVAYQYSVEQVKLSTSTVLFHNSRTFQSLLDVHLFPRGESANLRALLAHCNV